MSADIDRAAPPPEPVRSEQPSPYSESTRSHSVVGVLAHDVELLVVCDLGERRVPATALLRARDFVEVVVDPADPANVEVVGFHPSEDR